jgi:bacteriocin-like protein
VTRVTEVSKIKNEGELAGIVGWHSTQEDNAMTKEIKPSETVEPVLELTEEELQTVTGGRKAGKEQHEFLVIRMLDIIIT